MTRRPPFRFETKHLMILFIVLVFSQIFISFIHSTSTSNLLSQTLDVYRRDSVERIADLTATSIELLLEQSLAQPPASSVEERAVIQKFNIMLSQQSLQKNVEEIVILMPARGRVLQFDDGQAVYEYFFRGQYDESAHGAHPDALRLYRLYYDRVKAEERLYSLLEKEFTFHVLVPFVPQGEFRGAIYMRIAPDMSEITRQINFSYDEVAGLFSALVLMGLLAMLYISNYSVQERDRAQEALFRERERQLRTQIEHQKEAHFTQRIYHAHHKAEKIMGFVKEDLRLLRADNLDKIRYRITKYANFIARVIYDMKSVEPPMEIIRGPLFHTDVNEVIRFLVEAIFLRVSRPNRELSIDLDLTEKPLIVPVNEYVIWGILEPLIQNSIDHNPDRTLRIVIQTHFQSDTGQGEIFIRDDGRGFPEYLLQWKGGRQVVFQEHETTKADKQTAGYGCYIAYEYSRRCGWRLEAENLSEGGARFHITLTDVTYEERDGN